MDQIKRRILLFITIFIFIGTVYGSVISGEGYTSGYNEGYYTHYAFENYCPLCGGVNCLETYHKGVNELTCTHCDADYSYSGRDKYVGGSRAWLTPFTPNKDKNNLKETTTTIIEEII